VNLCDGENTTTVTLLSTICSVKQGQPLSDHYQQLILETVVQPHHQDNASAQNELIFLK
jgi:hypothetical protein